MSFLAKWSGLFNRQASSGHAPVSTQSLCRCFYCGTAAEYPARAFVEFLQQADFRDAGKAAAEELLALNLGAVLREFLGDGNWEPDPDQIAACQLSPRDPGST